ncbi:LysR family transcriptional regulator [Clostridium sp. AF32-12BH]|uniref:LysR family transcriptional regulator n=1 Tax=Clostridium sp. AF32-12BH TaxID=2292006 RepID=UPI0015FBA47E|nr:LysR family transcriptional regulator [Clostridium sp. AF32-12BH]
MDFSQLENAIKISESESINQASMNLYLTQSALNQQLLRLEREFGVKLFQRSKAGVIPTEAGNVFLDYARRILDLKQELSSVMNDYAEYKTGVIKIGLPTIRGYELFTNVFPIFHEKYPLIKLEPLELSVRRQKILLSHGDIDLAFMTLSESDESDDVYVPIQSEEIFLVMPKQDPLIKSLPKSDIDLSVLKDKKFVLIYRDSTLRRFTDRLFAEAGFQPNILLETSNHQTIANLVSNGYACSIVPKMYISDTSKVVFYHLPGHPSWMLCGAYKKGSYLSQPKKDLLQMVTDYWTQK